MDMRATPFLKVLYKVLFQSNPDCIRLRALEDCQTIK